MFTGTAMHEMGAALRIAQHNQWAVEVLHEGRWLHGRVDSLDAHGVVLVSTHAGSVAVALERIDRVRVLSAPERRPLEMRRVRSA